ncbi:MAG: response regulator transcription factor [Bacteroidetes bacterium]|nr:response regulator transcription factor [Bacteroidota bacterium]MBL7104021.1 response regulator transcription factor [Bacteroidales bacterium]
MDFKQRITAIIVDDILEAAEFLENLLQEFEAIELLPSAYNVDDAIDSIIKNKPQLVFLDVEMPDKTGFDLIRELKELDINPTIIFTTAFDQYAIDAIRYAAFDYLLKPINPHDLRKVVERYKAEMKNADFHKKVENLINRLDKDKLKFNTRTGFTFVNPDDVIYIQADSNYSNLHLVEDKTVTLSMTLKGVREILPLNQFYRINRSTIINKKFLTEINRKEKVCLLKVDEKELSFCIPPKYVKRLDI